MLRRIVLLLALSVGVMLVSGGGGAEAAPAGKWSDQMDGSWYNTADARYSGYGRNVAGASEDYPFVIRNGAELAYLGSFDGKTNPVGALAGKYIRLHAADGVIDLSGHEWVPVNLTGGGARVSFDGNQTVIAGMALEDEYVEVPVKMDEPRAMSAGAMGLFGRISGAVVKNLKIDEAEIEAGETSGFGPRCADLYPWWHEHYENEETGVAWLDDPDICSVDTMGVLAGVVENAVVRDVAVTRPNIDIAPDIASVDLETGYTKDTPLFSMMLGGMAGYLTEGSAIEGTSYVRGGEVVYMPYYIHDYYDLNVEEAIGGMVGYSYASRVQNACANTTVVADYTYDYYASDVRTSVGGLVGVSSGEVASGSEVREPAALGSCILNSCSQAEIRVVLPELHRYDVVSVARLLPTSDDMSPFNAIAAYYDMSLLTVGGIAGTLLMDSAVNNYYDGEIEVVYNYDRSSPVPVMVGATFGLVENDGVHYGSWLGADMQQEHRVLYNFYSSADAHWNAIGDTDERLDWNATREFGSYEKLAGWMSEGRAEVADLLMRSGEFDGMSEDEVLATVAEWKMMNYGESGCVRGMSLGHVAQVVGAIGVPKTGLFGFSFGGGGEAVAVSVAGVAVLGAAYGVTRRIMVVRNGRIRGFGRK